MNTQTKIGLSALALAVAFASGRYSTQGSTTKTIETKKIDAEISTDRDTHKKTVITKAKDGSEVTTITEDTTAVIKERQDETDRTATTTTAKSSRLNISALAGTQFPNLLKPVYGASISKEFIGPVTVGLWTLTNGTVGISVGLNF